MGQEILLLKCLKMRQNVQPCMHFCLYSYREVVRSPLFPDFDGGYWGRLLHYRWSLFFVVMGFGVLVAVSDAVLRSTQG